MRALVNLRLADGATEANIREWYNIRKAKRTRILNTQLASAFIYMTAKDAWGDDDRAIAYAKARVPWLSDHSIDAPPPDESDQDRPLFCCVQPRIDRWMRTMKLGPCTNDELDQRMAAGNHKTINSLIRSEMRAGKL